MGSRDKQGEGDGNYRVGRAWVLPYPAQMLLHFKPETSLRLITNARLMCRFLPDSGRGSGKDSREGSKLGPQDGSEDGGGGEAKSQLENQA